MNALGWLELAATLTAGFTLGILAAYALKIFRVQAGEAIAAELLRQTDAERQRQVGAVIETVRESFGNLSLAALSQATEQLTSLSKMHLSSERELHAKDLESSKGFIDQQLKAMGSQLAQVSSLVKDLEKDREQKFGELATRLSVTNEQTSSLISLTTSLRETLSSSQSRGQWGERIADDILRLAGLVENVSFHKQRTIDGIGTKPDFTFLLPHNQTINMDVKFPIANYARFIEAHNPNDRERFKKEFFVDVKARIREVCTRGYVNTQQNTVDCVILFIPNEQVFSFIQSEEPGLLDDALRNKIICCSPMTLFAVLAVIRQSVENFSIEKTSQEILDYLTEFRKQWDKFIDRFDNLGSKISSLQKEYEGLVTTRRRQLERPLEKLDEIRSEKSKLPTLNLITTDTPVAVLLPEESP